MTRDLLEEFKHLRLIWETQPWRFPTQFSTDKDNGDLDEYHATTRHPSLDELESYCQDKPFGTEE